MRTYYSKTAATSIIIANMIGTGVFTSIGFQLVDIKSIFLILLLWAIGGIAALCGAATYAELGAALPRSGGEYNFLGRIYHPLAGFISGWISTVIGFAAPIAAVALAFSDYSTAIIFGSQPIWIKKIIACFLVITITLIHVKNKDISSKFQIGFTSIKILLIVGFCFCAFTITPEPQSISFLPQKARKTPKRASKDPNKRHSYCNGPLLTTESCLRIYFTNSRARRQNRDWVYHGDKYIWCKWGCCCRNDALLIISFNY